MSGTKPRSRAVWRRVAGVVVALALASGGRAQVGEYDLKAAFLYNFAQFVDWPADAFASPDAPFVIGVVAPDPFGDTLEEMVRGEFIKGHRLAVRRFRSAEEIGPCHILFVPSHAAPDVTSALPDLAARHVLTVGESDEMLSRGATVGFRMENQKVRIQINLDAVRAANLTVSSKLLRAAEVRGATETGAPP